MLNPRAFELHDAGARARAGTTRPDSQPPGGNARTKARTPPAVRPRLPSPWMRPAPTWSWATTTVYWQTPATQNALAQSHRLKLSLHDLPTAQP